MWSDLRTLIGQWLVAFFGNILPAHATTTGLCWEVRRDVWISRHLAVAGGQIQPSLFTVTSIAANVELSFQATSCQRLSTPLCGNSQCVVISRAHSDNLTLVACGC